MTSNIYVKMVENDEECFHLAHLAKLHRDELAPHLSFDLEFTFLQARSIAANSSKEGFHCWLAYLDDEPVGYFVGSISTYLFSADLRADQHIWYLKPSNRIANLARLMMTTFEEYARDANCVECITGVECEDIDHAEKVAKLITRLGYKKTGYSFNKLMRD